LSIEPEEVVFELSGGALNTDPLLSFGGARSNSTPIEEFEGTLTSNQPADRRILFDSVAPGADDDHNGKWLLFMDGPNALSFSRILAFRASDGRFILEERMGATALSGDFYRVFEVNSLFHNVNANDCAFGHTDYRLIYQFHTQAAETAELIQYYLEQSNPGRGASNVGVEFEIWALLAAASTQPNPADEETKPAGTTPVSDFTRTTGYFDARSQPQELSGGTAPSSSTNQTRAVYIRRIIAPNARRQPFGCVLIVCELESSIGGATIRSGFLIPWSMAGFTPLIDITRDRGPVLSQSQRVDGYDSALYVGAGARYSAAVTAVETGLLVPDLEMGWTLTGPGQLFTPDETITDDEGVARVTLSSPVGAAATLQTIVQDTSSLAAPLNDVTTISVSHIIPSATERVLHAWVAVVAENDPPADTTPYQGKSVSVTYGGESMVLVASVSSTEGGRLECWQLVAPPIGTASVVVTLHASARAVGLGAQSFSGVDQVSPIDATPAVVEDPNAVINTLSYIQETVTANALINTSLMPFHPADLGVTPDAPQVAAELIGVGLSPLVAIMFLSTQPAVTPGSQSVGWTFITTGDRVSACVPLRPALTDSTLTAKV
jgi:hypothetical protein